MHLDRLLDVEARNHQGHELQAASHGHGAVSKGLLVLVLTKDHEKRPRCNAWDHTLHQDGGEGQHDLAERKPQDAAQHRDRPVRTADEDGDLRGRDAWRLQNHLDGANLRRVNLHQAANLDRVGHRLPDELLRYGGKCHLDGEAHGDGQEHPGGGGPAGVLHARSHHNADQGVDRWPWCWGQQEQEDADDENGQRHPEHVPAGQDLVRVGQADHGRLHADLETRIADAQQLGLRQDASGPEKLQEVCAEKLRSARHRFLQPLNAARRRRFLRNVLLRRHELLSAVLPLTDDALQQQMDPDEGPEAKQVSGLDPLRLQQVHNAHCHLGGLCGLQHLLWAEVEDQPSADASE
mmetsp:Transcript_37269/g.111334  ORF Transcript_37269/g.111334 Transcript_37269/m.111334 type:complete len:350 (-) Transcript_37269:240-1289(-)